MTNRGVRVPHGRRAKAVKRDDPRRRCVYEPGCPVVAPPPSYGMAVNAVYSSTEGTTTHWPFFIASPVKS